MNHISDDVTTYPDLVFHYKRYVCNVDTKHVTQILYDKHHNNEKVWKEFDKKMFGYDTQDDDPNV